MSGLGKMLVLTGSFPVVSQTFVLREIRAAKDLGWTVRVLACSSGHENGFDQAAEFGIAPEDYRVVNWRSCFPTFYCHDKEVNKAADCLAYGRYLAMKRVTFFKELLKDPFTRQADIIHSHFVQWASEVGCGLSELLKIPLIVEAHDSHLPNYSNATLKKVQYHASTIGCVSNEWINIWEKKTGSRNKLHLLPNGVELSEFPLLEKKVKERPQIISISNCVEHKRPQDLLKAASILCKKRVDFSLTIIGGGPYLDELIELRRSLDLEQVCEILGSLPHSQVREQLSNADIFALCSERESFGIVSVEAMCSGLPTVVSRTAGANDIVSDGVTGYIFKVGDVEQLANYLERLILDRELRSTMGKKGRSRVESYFSWERHMQIVTGIWDRALKD